MNPQHQHSIPQHTTTTTTTSTQPWLYPQYLNTSTHMNNLAQHISSSFFQLLTHNHPQFQQHQFQHNQSQTQENSTQHSGPPQPNSTHNSVPTIIPPQPNSKNTQKRKNDRQQQQHQA
eukprot:TRINITY_DN314_c0_g1_i3.p1 TRINITY_DN314_c0_g1~~TRINITY_DN314_c0_g1_i3.p1  ORF type:complete len:118 (+),score=21.76 TRINITY_DN314_c0_g1_i3:60-413(+)